MAEGTDGIGARLAELRAWRKMSLRATAELAGCSASFLSRAERGLTTVDSRARIDGFAYALRVAPGEILGEPTTGRDPINAEAHAAIERIGVVLAHNRIGHPFQEEQPEWAPLRDRLRHFVDVLVPACDYIAQAGVLPALIEDLYTAHATDPAHRRDALVGLMFVFQHAAALLKNLGAHGMPHMASLHMRYVADELEDPAWTGVAEWRVGQSSGGDRARMLAVSLRAADNLDGNPDPRARHALGMLHLNAALASASLRREDDARTHLAEAHDLVHATEGTEDFADLHFGSPNWMVWRVAVGVELGEGPKVAELARDLDVSALPAAERRGMFYGDVARGLAQDRRTQPAAVAMMWKAEREAPQRIRTNPYARETVRGLMRQAKRDSVGRDLRGLAWRMGLAV